MNMNTLSLLKILFATACIFLSSTPIYCAADKDEKVCSDFTKVSEGEGCKKQCRRKCKGNDCEWNQGSKTCRPQCSVLDNVNDCDEFGGCEWNEVTQTCSDVCSVFSKVSGGGSCTKQCKRKCKKKNDCEWNRTEKTCEPAVCSDFLASIACTVISPANVVTCDGLRAPASLSCPADASLLSAYLEYDGRFGPSVFVVPTCDNSELFTRTVNAGEVTEFRNRGIADSCEAVTFTIYDSDPLTGGIEVGSAEAPIACPGPWTIGSEVAPGLILRYFASTTDGGISFDFIIQNVDIQVEYIAINGAASPLNVTGGEFSAPAPFTSGAFTPGVIIPDRSQKVFFTETVAVDLTGKAGTTLQFSMFVSGTSTNELDLACDSSTNLQLGL